MKTLFRRFCRFSNNYPLVSGLIILNLIGLMAMGYHYYSLKLAKEAKERKVYEIALHGILTVLYPHEFDNLSEAKRIFNLNIQYSKGSSPSDEDLNWLLAEFQAPPTITGINLYDRYGYIINTLIYASFHMNSSQRLVTEPAIDRILPLLPNGNGHIVSINCAMLIANMHNKRDIPILKTLLSNYSNSQERTRIQRAITCIADKKLDYGP